MSAPNPAPTGVPAPPPTIGVDTGAVWTASVLRVGDYPVHGWTLGPVNKFGVLDRGAVQDIDNWPAVQRYINRLMHALDELAEYATTNYGQVRIGVETPGVPTGWQPGNKPKYNRLPVVEWVMPKLVTAAVLGAYPDARLVPPDKHGKRPIGEYPKEIRGHRLPEWGPMENTWRDRQHERAAFDIAGVAMGLP